MWFIYNGIFCTVWFESDLLHIPIPYIYIFYVEVKDIFWVIFRSFLEYLIVIGQETLYGHIFLYNDCFVYILSFVPGN